MAGDPQDTHSGLSKVLFPTIVSPALRALMQSDPGALHSLIIECNADYPNGVGEAKDRVRRMICEVAGAVALARDDAASIGDYVYAVLDWDSLNAILAKDGSEAMSSDEARTAPASSPEVAAHAPPPAPRRAFRAIHRVWPSTKLRHFTVESIRTIKADAAHASFAALGANITWAVLDSGVDRTHPHFHMYSNILTTGSLLPKNFSPTPGADPLDDPDGHGTHVAGIIAGQCDPTASTLAAIQAIAEDGTPSEFHLQDVAAIRGMAPRCNILSLRIFDDKGDGDDTAAIQALEYVMVLNSFGAHIRVHGVNLSAGYLPDPETYGIGQSPLCRTIDRLVRSGVVVVCAAGNFGWTPGSSDATGATQPGQSGALASIADPGNANLAITVGSTHRQEPHRYRHRFPQRDRRWTSR